MDYYKLLEVSRTATPEEIKQAYRRLAKEHHPDRTGGDDSHFKKINEAYDTLKDPVRRSEYDSPQPQFHSQQDPFAGFDNLDPYYRNLFRNFQAQQQTKVRNRDITVSVTLTLEEVITGKSLVAKYKLFNGATEVANVNIPAGVSTGDKIKFGQLGDNSLKGITRGDLIIVVKVKAHSTWRRDGNNLHKVIKVDIFDLLLGTSVDFYTIDSKLLKLNIKKGTKPGTVLSLSGYGLPSLNSPQRGNVFVKIDTTIPIITDEEILEKIRNIKNEINPVAQ
jgi:curved DNA-binding protein